MRPKDQMRDMHRQQTESSRAVARRRICRSIGGRTRWPGGRFCAGIPALARLVLVSALAIPVGACTVEVPAAPGLVDAISISYQRHALSDDDAGAGRVGRLVYRGGLVLYSPDSRFGGWSGLLVSADGKRMLSQSDEGHWLRADLVYDDQGDLAGVGGAELADMRDRAGETMPKRRGDAEGLAALSPAGLDGSVLVSFEQKARVWRYDVGRSLDARPSTVAMPGGIAVGDNNRGLEGLTLLDAHTLFAVMESPHGDSPDMDAWLVCYPQPGSCAHSGPLRVAFHRPYYISDAAMGPDGTHLYLLERRFLGLLGGLAIAVREIETDRVKPGALLQGVEIARFDGRAGMDNMEGLALRRGSDGKTYVYMISDDNYDHSLQRTLLLMFELKPADPPPSVSGACASPRGDSVLGPTLAEVFQHQKGRPADQHHGGEEGAVGH